MKPLQVYMDSHELARLSAWSRERGWTKSQAVRAAVRALTARAGEDPLLRASGFIDGLPADLGVRFDQYLEETYVAAAEPPKRSRRTRPTNRVRR